MSHDILTLKDYLGIIRFSRAYGCFYLGMVLLSIGVIIMSVYLPHPHPLWFIVLEGLLTILFSLEIFLQIAVQRGMYFRSSMFNNIEFALCVASMVAYMEVIFQMNVQGSLQLFVWHVATPQQVSSLPKPSSAPNPAPHSTHWACSLLYAAALAVQDVNFRADPPQWAFQAQ
eukprot:GGOE01004537.1.p1 GENE.GGOE01004537.1~~GGOE01004537.1.p1  ORF type:complete len:172 (-),score=23.67 GGOE01004537.1:369-884(-)